MSKKSLFPKKRSFWKWAISSLSPLGVFAGTIVKWVVSGAGAVAAINAAAVAKAVAVTAVVAGAGAVFSFSFGDKAESFDRFPYAARVFLASGKNEQAVEYADGLITALNKDIDALRSEVASKRSTESSTSSKNLLRRRLVQKLVAELFKADIRRRDGQITLEQWRRSFEGALQDDAEARQVVRGILKVEGGRFSEDLAWELAANGLPAEVRGQFALWLDRYKAPSWADSAQQCTEFYERLLLCVGDLAEAAFVLERYVKALDMRSCTNEANDYLDTLIPLYGDCELGAAAARLRLGAIEPGPDRDARVIAVVRENPGSVIARGLAPDYSTALIRRGETWKALVAADSEGRLETIDDERAKAEVLLALAERVCAFPPSIPDRLGEDKAGQEETKPAEKQQLDSLSVCVVLAKELFDAGDYSASAELVTVALRKDGSLPVNLAAGLTIEESSELGDMADPKVAEPVAGYLLAAIHRAVKETELGDAILEGLSSRTSPESIQPYVCHMMAERAALTGDHESALTWIAKGLVFIPASPVLALFEAEVNQAREELVTRRRIDKEQRRCLVLADSAKTSEEAIKQYQRMAQLCLSIGDLEQAAGAHLLIVAKFSGNQAAPAALSEAIRLLGSSDKDRNAGRIEALTGKLLSAYADSRQASQFNRDRMKVSK